MKRSKPKARILLTAHELFYENGYANTGVDTIIACSQTHKASFYRHFPSKQVLGDAYLDHRVRSFEEMLADIVARSESPCKLFKLWQAATVKLAKRGDLKHGCPIARFRAQVGTEISHFQPRVNGAYLRWQKSLQRFFAQQNEVEHLRSKSGSQRAAISCLRTYQGALQIYAMTNNLAYLRSLAHDVAKASAISQFNNQKPL